MLPLDKLHYQTRQNLFGQADGQGDPAGGGKRLFYRRRRKNGLGGYRDSLIESPEAHADRQLALWRREALKRR